MKTKRPGKIKTSTRRIKPGASRDPSTSPASVLHRLKTLAVPRSSGKSPRKKVTRANNIRPGLRILFTGSGTEAKLPAGRAVSERLQLELYRIDLSAVISKYIGETEKNLERLFNTAENKSWLLFFDEADALFGKRTQVRDSHDRYANQETAYLLQRLDVFVGPVIMALNRKGPLASVWRRRFPKVIHFPPPRPSRKHKE